MIIGYGQLIGSSNATLHSRVESKLDRSFSTNEDLRVVEGELSP